MGRDPEPITRPAQVEMAFLFLPVKQLATGGDSAILLILFSFFLPGGGNHVLQVTVWAGWTAGPSVFLRLLSGGLEDIEVNELSRLYSLVM